MLKPLAKENQGKRNDLTSSRNLPQVNVREEVAKIAKVSHDTVFKVKYNEKE